MIANARAHRDEVRTFWTGPELSLYERLSLSSFVQAEAKVQLFTYDRGLVVPEGVERVDANEILPGTVYGFRFASGDTSFALHSNLVRYAIIEKFGGWYADLDIVLIGKALPDVPIYVARETDDVINVAVMKFPAHHPLMSNAIGEAWRLLPETSKSTSLQTRVTLGPTLITRLLKELSLNSLVRPRSTAYEIGYDEVIAFFDPASCERLQERLADSDFTHLWNQVWRWVRIPKDHGPPEGSYLDSLFVRAGIEFPARARLTYSAIVEWFREHRLAEYCKRRLGEDRIPADAIDRVFGPSRSPQRKNETLPIARTVRAAEPFSIAKSPQVVQTFWHGHTIGLYQLMCLRSFVDRGHKVELFTYNVHLRLPTWISRRRAAEIIPKDKILRSLEDRIAVNRNLFRYALLHQRGGWWVDPDVVLFQPELPTDQIFFSGSNGFGRTSTSLLRFPKGHKITDAGLSHALELGDAGRDWGKLGAPFLTELIRRSDLKGRLDTGPKPGPVSWFDVPALFDPSRRQDLEESCRSALALQLHGDVWRRSGIPQRLGPPKGSLLDELFARHDVSASFSDLMTFDEVNRWVGNLYQCVRGQQQRMGG